MTSCYLCGCDHADDRLGACDVCKAAVENRRTLRSDRIHRSNETGKKVTLISLILGPIVFIVFASYVLQPTAYTVEEGGNSYDLIDSSGTVRFAYDKGSSARLVMYPVTVERIRDPLLSGGASFNVRYVESPELQAVYFETILGQLNTEPSNPTNTKSISLILTGEISADQAQEILRNRQGVTISGVELFPHGSEDALLQRAFLVRGVAKSE